MYYYGRGPITFARDLVLPLSIHVSDSLYKRYKRHKKKKNNAIILLRLFSPCRSRCLTHRTSADTPTDSRSTTASCHGNAPTINNHATTTQPHHFSVLACIYSYWCRACKTALVSTFQARLLFFFCCGLFCLIRHLSSSPSIYVSPLVVVFASRGHDIAWLRLLLQAFSSVCV